MAVFKCKMCGGNLEFTDGQSYGTCDSCGSTMTLPRGNDERVINLFNRATHYRQQNEFDKAIATYESILEEDSENAEAYWGLVLSKYGIEYVEDPKTHKRIPTCHRLQHDSILSDLDYQSALKYAIDSHAQRLYEEEAEKISEIQKNILSVANKEAAYDMFICYKESDNSGKRTIDSVLAQDIYTNLTNEGYKVFFSRITLEDKLGQEYEPYIFAALHSARVMLVVGTNKDNFNAVWVKNEWSRFLALSKKDKSKLIIPCYRDMDAYDLPDELSMFQSQDMNKIGFMQDLTRGIKKVIGSEENTVNQNQSSGSMQQAESLLKRAFLFLEEAEWEKADELLEQVLNLDPENARACLGKLMVDVNVNKEENLGRRAIKLSENPNYQKAIRFADNDFQQTLEQYNANATKKYNENKSIRLQKETEERNNLMQTYQIEKKKLEALTQKRKKIFLPIIILLILGFGLSLVSFMFIGNSKTVGIGVFLVFSGFIILAIAGIYYAIFSFSPFNKKYNQKTMEVNALETSISQKDFNINSIENS